MNLIRKCEAADTKQSSSMSFDGYREIFFVSVMFTSWTFGLSDVAIGHIVRSIWVRDHRFTSLFRSLLCMPKSQSLAFFQKDCISLG